MSLSQVFVQGQDRKIQYRTSIGYCGRKIQLFHDFIPMNPANSLNKYIKFEVAFENILPVYGIISNEEKLVP